MQYLVAKQHMNAVFGGKATHEYTVCVSKRHFTMVYDGKGDTWFARRWQGDAWMESLVEQRHINTRFGGKATYECSCRRQSST